MESPPTVFVVDDDHPARLSLTALLEAHGFICRGFGSADAFLAGYGPRQAGCLVTELELPGMTGLDLHSELQRRGWMIPSVMVAGYVDISQTVQAMQQGVISVLEKPYPQEELLKAVHLALDTDSRLRASARKLAELNRLFSQLTAGEVEVLDRIVAGQLNKVIAAELGVTIRAVEQRRKRIYQKLGVQGVAALVALVVERDQLVDSNRDARRLAEVLYGITCPESPADSQSSRTTV